MRQFTVRTTAKYELADITKLVTEIFASTPIQTGLLTVFVPHTTAAIVCNEHEPRLKSDILRVVKTVEKQSVFFGGFKHNADEGNAHAHIISALTGPSRSFIIENGQIQLGPWQSIMLLEMDGPRDRQIYVQVMPSLWT